MAIGLGLELGGGKQEVVRVVPVCSPMRCCSWDRRDERRRPQPGAKDAAVCCLARGVTPCRQFAPSCCGVSHLFGVRVAQVWFLSVACREALETHGMVWCEALKVGTFPKHVSSSPILWLLHRVRSTTGQ